MRSCLVVAAVLPLTLLPVVSALRSMLLPMPSVAAATTALSSIERVLNSLLLSPGSSSSPSSGSGGERSRSTLSSTRTVSLLLIMTAAASGSSSRSTSSSNEPPPPPAADAPNSICVSWRNVSCSSSNVSSIDIDRELEVSTYDGASCLPGLTSGEKVTLRSLRFFFRGVPAGVVVDWSIGGGVCASGIAAAAAIIVFFLRLVGVVVLDVVVVASEDDEGGD
mmetsp:Transcript_3208/g.6949  ORF Transcript_3208/g.6949 Transcript_3208/m.6949 type:complete len:222 (-) Transcript_3208:1141-1806(-)